MTQGEVALPLSHLMVRVGPWQRVKIDLGP
jgi:hypothetical protein